MEIDCGRLLFHRLLSKKKRLLYAVFKSRPQREINNAILTFLSDNLFIGFRIRRLLKML